MPDQQAAAMLDCEDGETEANSNCKHCQASGDSQQRYWDIQLDQDLLETICGIYPEWFKDCNMNLGPENSAAQEAKSKREDASQKAIDKNKESLKVKLMLRRPFNQLVDQGIIPPLKSSTSFHDSKQKLERSKMGDILKHKIQNRPERQELIQQHILEDSYIDNSLQDRQRQLKRARLADSLNERLTQRPGPLELVKVNILHAEDIFSQVVQDAGLSFRGPNDTPSPQLRLGLEDDSGSDGTFSPSPPYDCNEHSQGSLPSFDANESSPNPNQGSPCSGGAFSLSPPSSVSSPLSVLPSVVSPQSNQQDHLSEYMVQMHQPKDSPSPNKNRKKNKPKTQPKARTIKFHEYKGPPNAQKNSSVSSSTSTEPSYDLLLQQQQLLLQWQLEWQQKYPQVVVYTPQKQNGDQISQSSQKSNTSNPTQPLFEAPPSPQKLLSKLEDLKVSDLKAELKKRNLPVSGSKPLLIERLKSYSELPQTSVSTSNNSNQSLNVQQVLDSLNTIPTETVNASNNISSADGGLDTIKSLLNSMGSTNSRSTPTLSLDIESTNGLDMGDVSEASSTSLTNEDIVQLQQRCIEKLQRELERSQLQLQQSIISQQSSPVPSNTKSSLHVPFTDSSSTPSISKSTASNSTTGSSDASEAVSSAETKSLQKQLIHQYLQQKIQLQQQRLLKETLKQQANLNGCSAETSSTNPNSTLTALLESRPMNASPVSFNPVASFSSSACVDGGDTAVVNEDSEFPGVIPIDTVSDTVHLDSAFDVVSPIMVNSEQSDTESTHNPVPNAIANRSASLPSFNALVSCKPTPTRSNTEPQFVITRPPPDYNEATRQLNKVKLSSDDGNPRQTKKHKSSVKSQVVDDVLEILIKNGELPPSAAQEPTTPVTPIPKTEQSSVPIFTNNNDVLFSKPMTTTSMMASTVAHAPVAKDVISSSPDLHISLQSVLELTPPSSAGFGDAGSAPTSSLDFDFSLDMPEIEGMDLGGLEENQTSVNSDPILPISSVKDSKPCLDMLNSNTIVSTRHLQRENDMVGINSRGPERNMDMELLQWLEVLEDTTAASSTSSAFQPSSYGISNDNDPLFSTNSHETLDLFSSDDIDFKPHHDLNFLPWNDKADFAA